MHQLDCENERDEGSHGGENSGHWKAAENFSRVGCQQLETSPHSIGMEFTFEGPAFLELALEQERNHVVSLASAIPATMVSEACLCMYRFVGSPVLQWKSTRTDSQQ